MDKILIAMSGGVDSSVAAYLMQQRGFSCVGATMRLYSAERGDACGGRTCCSLDDVEDARGVACMLHIPYYVFNFTDAFRTQVIDRFVAAYRQGRTPNPCIDCNRYLKFHCLYERAELMGCRGVATGHYARIERSGDRFLLKKAVCAEKDQSYVLAMTQSQLAHTFFPLGELRKEETRRIAAEQGFRNAAKRDSQDICFVPDGDYVRFITEYTGETPPCGDFTDAHGTILGRHRGIIRYTLGQRKGLGVSSDAPLYVCRIDAAENRVVLGRNEALFSRALEAAECNWIAFDRPGARFRAEVKIRYRHEAQPALVEADGTRMRVLFDQPQRAVTPGQFVVLYEGDTVLGGGVIDRSEV
ncbi:MAG: tRNA 2-thiouridine(34) synthase MnmA [Oscillibacter sp.]|nr:tRNA 2-thiouridine(34) synthase MnmA [Oscillibacter sp.]